MLYRIQDFEARSGYRVWVRFADGVEGEVALSELVGRGVFARWNDPAEFGKVFIDEETGTLAWPGGIDLAPDALYRDVSAVRAG
jgi:hypothetical protein